MEMEGFRILCDRDGRKWRFTDFAFPKWTETEVCKFCISIMDGIGGFADFVFAKWMEMEVYQFCVSVMDRNEDSVSITDGNRISISIHFHQAHFPFSVSPPSSQNQCKVLSDSTI